jgi:broad specificity phosphatase PhoE
MPVRSPKATGKPAIARPDADQVRVVLVRHAEAGDVEMIGCIGAPLTPRGERQLPYIAKRLTDERFDHVYASDMTRAHETAKAILEHHDGTPVSVIKDVREVGGHHLRRGRTSRARGVREKVARERRAAERFAKRLLSEHRGDLVLVVCHGNFIRLLISVLSGINPKRAPYINTGNTSVTILTLRTDGKMWASSPVRIDLANCTRHLPESASR